MQLVTIGFCLSGSGPSQLTLCRSAEQANKLLEDFKKIYKTKNIGLDFYIGKINSEGARIV